MRQVVQNYKTGELALLDVPVPACKPGGVLVRTSYSLISTGTEMMKVSEASMSMLGKARARPDQVAKVLQSVATNGFGATYRKVQGKLDSYTPLGYSLCGVVTEVGTGVDGVVVGDLVACAGNEYALHSEFNWVPANLFCVLPTALDPRHAAFGTVGAIALQGVRRGESQLGEVALVVGLGLIGQLVVQLLAASGVRVIGVDPDAGRCELAQRLGALMCGDPKSGVVDSAVDELTGGYGVDQVYLAAGGNTNEPVELAAKLSRDRGRVVDIGKCKLDLPWNAYYEKELDVRFSRSYGPGRYDHSYEVEGRDYPIGYVRWTERRNIECFLDLMARDRIDVEPLISHIAEFESAVETYKALNAGELEAVAVLFGYRKPDGGGGTDPPSESPAVPTSNGHRVTAPRHAAADLTPGAGTTPGRELRAAFIGAGNYASSMLLPHLAALPDVRLVRAVTTSALSAANAQRKFGFADACTDTRAAIDDPEIDAVFVVTRHSSHAALAEQALRAGKAVFVEKPMALDGAELDLLCTAIAESGNDRLHVGFNRRFAPLLGQAQQRLGDRVGPASVRYLVNAGRLEEGSWYGRRHSEGSRFVGEGGHFIDTVGWLLGADPCTLFARATPKQGDLQLLLTYPDGSTATITYAASGAASFPKETIDLLADGKVLHLNDFARASVHGKRRWSAPRVVRGRDKGQRAQLAEFVAAVRTGSPMPIPLDSLVATTRATLAVATSLACGKPVELAARAAGAVRS